MVAYRRPQPRFIYLERREGPQIMLCERWGKWETGPMKPPYGRDVMFQVYVEDLAPVIAAVEARRWPVYEGLREV